MANRRCFQTLTLHLCKSTPPFLHHVRALTQIPNLPLKSLYPKSHFNFSNPNTNYSSNHYTTYRHFSSDRRDNNSDDNDETENEEDESDYDDVANSGVKREYSPEEKESEAAAIGYKVIGQLQRSDRVFKLYEPVFAVIQVLLFYYLMIFDSFVSRNDHFVYLSILVDEPVLSVLTV